ncbi:MAG: hypothetical protein OER88_03965 [Planctomycetota bacterium]|nr:hypothetical protein [Planctomycetota bacterium]
MRSANSRLSVTPWVVLAGLLLGVATGLHVWPDGFPYEVVTGPFRRLPNKWALTFALGLYGALWGWLLARPTRRWPIVLVVIAAHASVSFAFRDASRPPSSDPSPQHAGSGVVLASARLVRRGIAEELALEQTYRLDESGRAAKLQLEVDVAAGTVRVRVRLIPQSAARGILSYALRREADGPVTEAEAGGPFERRTVLTGPSGAPMGVTGFFARRSAVDAIEAAAELAVDGDAVVVIECEGNALGETHALGLRLEFRRAP